MTKNKLDVPMVRNAPLNTTDLEAGQFYECILSGQRALCTGTAAGAAQMRMYNRVTGEFLEFLAANNQFRKL